MFTVYILSHPSPHESRDLCLVCRWTGSLPAGVCWNLSGPHHGTQLCTGSWIFTSKETLPLYLKGMATPSRILAWRIPWTEEPGGLQSMGSQRVGHNWATCFYPYSDSFYVLFLKFFINQLLRFYWVLEIDYTPKLFQIFIHSEIFIEYPPHNWQIF